MAKDTRARMLDTTARLLQHRGYYGTSLNDILEASGAPRGSLYFHFPGGKDQLVLEATRAAVEEATQALRGTLATATTPGQGVRAFVEAAARIMRDTDYTFGCPVAPVILDATDGFPELAELCRRAFEEWVGLMESSFVAAGWFLGAWLGVDRLFWTICSIAGLALVGFIGRHYWRRSRRRAVATG